MMKKYRVMLCGVGAAFLLAACGGEEVQIVEQEEITEVSWPEEEKTEEPAETEDLEEAAPEELPAETEQAEASDDKPVVVTIETENQEYKDGDRVLLTTVYDHVTVVVEGNEEATKLIMAEFEKSEKEFPEGIEETLEWARENPAVAEGGIHYDQEHGYKVERNDGRVLSFSSLVGGYEGGAHGYYMEYGLNSAAKTGKLLTIADVAADQDAFREICVEKMLEKYEELRAEGRVFEEEMIPPSLREVLEGKMEGEEWYFTEDGVRFISNIYEIAPYAEGETLYDIPYELVNDVLKEEYRR